jgi:hypothetical protein
VFSLPLREGPLGAGFLIEPKLYTITYRFAETGGLVYTVEKTQ